MELGFYAWECISLLKTNGTTLDLVVKNETDLMAALSVFLRLIYKQPDCSQMKVFQLLKLKMKLSYQCYRRKTVFSHLILKAINKSVNEKLKIASLDLHRFLKNDDGNRFDNKSQASDSMQDL